MFCVKQLRCDIKAIYSGFETLLLKRDIIQKGDIFQFYLIWIVSDECFGADFRDGISQENFS